MHENHPKHSLGLAGIVIISSPPFPSHEGLDNLDNLDNLDLINYVTHVSTLPSASYLFLGQKVCNLHLPNHELREFENLDEQDQLDNLDGLHNHPFRDVDINLLG